MGVALLSAIVGLPAPLQAQALAVSVPAGAQVRVETTAGRRAQGRVVELRPDTLILRTRAPIPERLGVADLRTLSVRGGRDRGRGLLLGAGVATAVTGVFGGIDYSRRRIGGGELAGTIASNAVFGAFVGWLLAPRGWLTVPMGR